MAHRIVVALGGNALQKNGDVSVAAQKNVAEETARQLVRLINDGHELIIAHGNGPQVGAILLNEENSKSPSPLDTCGAMSQGQIGYWLQQALDNELRTQGIARPVATVVTQVVVDVNDPAFEDPSKPIGPFYNDEQQARAAARDRGFVVKEDAGRGWRRVVASPQPQDIVEGLFIKQAVERDNIVIAAGGGGIPVIEHEGRLVGVEAVIDKDFAAERLAELVEADILLVLTGVDAASINFRQADEEKLGHVTPAQLHTYISQNQFAPGSMLPKVQAAVRFVESGPNRTSIITSLDNVSAAIDGTSGTHVVNS
jgi:carbamate kinase